MSMTDVSNKLLYLLVITKYLEKIILFHLIYHILKSEILSQKCCYRTKVSRLTANIFATRGPWPIVLNFVCPVGLMRRMPVNF